MPVKVFTNAEIDFVAALATNSPDFAVVAAAWPPDGMEGDSGLVTLTSWLSLPQGGQMLSLIGVPHDDGSVPPVITMTDAFVEFDWAVTNGAGVTAPTSRVDCAGTLFDTQGAGSSSGSFSEHNDPATYFGGTDRATLFSAGMALEYFGFWTGAFAAHDRRIAWTNYVLTITYDVPGSVISVNPPTGSVNGGQVVTIHGTGFTGATGAEFGGVAVTSFAVVDDETATGITGPHASGVVDVEVLGVATGTALYTYVIPPTFNLDPIPSRSPIRQGKR